MKKLPLLVGATAGFVLVSQMGRGPYERLEAQIRQLAGRPEAKGVVGAGSDKATELTDTVAGAVTKASASAGRCARAPSRAVQC